MSETELVRVVLGLKEQVDRLLEQRQAEEVLTLAEAAVMGKCSTGTIRNRIKSGVLENVGEGRNVRIRKSAMLAYLARPAQRQPAKAAIEDRADAILKGKR